MTAPVNSPVECNFVWARTPHGAGYIKLLCNPQTIDKVMELGSQAKFGEYVGLVHGKARSHHIANISGATLRPILTAHVSRKSTLMTDTAGGYMGVGKEFGLPYYVHMLGKHSFRVAAENHELIITDDTVGSAIADFLEDTEQFYHDDYYTGISSNQTDTQFKEVLLACAMAARDDSGFFSATSVIAPLSVILGRLVKHANFQRHLSEFLAEARGPMLIRRGSERQYRYRFCDPMMQPYILMRGITDGLIPQSPPS
jgi:hypothetical protein